MTTNTYRVFVLETGNNNSTVVATHVAYIQAVKYGPAWNGARSLLNDGKPHKENPLAKALFSDPECKTDAKLGFGDHLTVAKIVDIKGKNVKLDASALQAILDDPNASPEQKLEAMQAKLAQVSKPKAPAEAK